MAVPRPEAERDAGSFPCSQWAGQIVPDATPRIGNDDRTANVFPLKKSSGRKIGFEDYGPVVMTPGLHRRTCKKGT